MVSETIYQSVSLDSHLLPLTVEFDQIGTKTTLDVYSLTMFPASVCFKLLSSRKGSTEGKWFKSLPRYELRSLSWCRDLKELLHISGSTTLDCFPTLLTRSSGCAGMVRWSVVRHSDILFVCFYCVLSRFGKAHSSTIRSLSSVLVGNGQET